MATLFFQLALLWWTFEFKCKIFRKKTMFEFINFNILLRSLVLAALVIHDRSCYWPSLRFFEKEVFSRVEF